MRDCSKQISKFHREEVALTGDERSGMHKRRNANRDRVKNGLAKAGKPKPIGMHSQGSYSMWTMIQDEDCDYDIDDGIYFDAHVLKGPQGGEMTPLQVRQMICDAVQDQRFNRAPETKTNCVRVFYNEGYHVDLPTYRRIAKRSIWTDKIEYTYELASSSWKASDPRAVTDWFKETNEDVSPDYANTEGQFRRVRRQNIRHNSRRRLAECGPRLGGDVRRRACGAASADIRWSFVWTCTGSVPVTCSC